LLHLHRPTGGTAASAAGKTEGFAPAEKRPRIVRPASPFLGGPLSCRWRAQDVGPVLQSVEKFTEACRPLTQTCPLSCMPLWETLVTAGSKSPKKAHTKPNLPLVAVLPLTSPDRLYVSLDDQKKGRRAASMRESQVLEFTTAPLSWPLSCPKSAPGVVTGRGTVRLSERRQWIPGGLQSRTPRWPLGNPGSRNERRPTHRVMAQKSLSVTQEIVPRRGGVARDGAGSVGQP